jgi:hypothetical protein
MRRPSRSLVAVVAAFMALAGAACGEGGGTEETRVAQLKTDIPDRVLDLIVKNESIASVQATERPYVDGVALYSLRDEELLQATLQVSRFNDDADPQSARFRGSVINQIGSSVPKAFRMGGNTVWLTTGRRQGLAVWFRDRHLFILSTRDEYEQPRRLLRQLLAVQP